MIGKNLRKIIGNYSPQYPAHDPTTPWYEWNMYVECCRSLDVSDQPSWKRYSFFRNYLKKIGII